VKAAVRIRRALVTWYRNNKRDLPWRRTHDPYAIWISETMLQQTRVEAVIPYWERWMKRFPDVAALATADADDVMGHWAGLGYYSRARNLHAAARTVVEELGGELPDDVAGLRDLKGVGRYTAGAVASIAFDRPAPVVDGNVARVLTRLLEIREDVASPSVVERLWKEAAALARGPNPGDLNQALMELGATVCTPRAPHCSDCPLTRCCGARAAGDPETMPVKQPKASPRRVEAVCALVCRRGRALAVRRPPHGLLGGLWELPGGELEQVEAAEKGLARSLRERVGLDVKGVERVGSVRHVFTHRVLELTVFRAEARGGRVSLDGFDAHRWLARESLADLPTSSVARKAMALAAS